MRGGSTGSSVMNNWMKLEIVIAEKMNATDVISALDKVSTCSTYVPCAWGVLPFLSSTRPVVRYPHYVHATTASA